MRKLVVLVVVAMLVLAIATPALAQEGQWEYWNDKWGWQYVLPGEYHQAADGHWVECFRHYGTNPEPGYEVWSGTCESA